MTTRNTEKARKHLQEYENDLERHYMSLQEQAQYNRDVNADEGTPTFTDPNKIEFGTRYNTPFVKTRNEPLPLYESDKPLLA